MYKILEKRELAPKIKQFVVAAPLVARKTQPGQFVIVRVHERGERIPLTVADYDRRLGTITLVVQEVGKTTAILGSLEPGGFIQDVVGPLGMPAEIRKIEPRGTVACVAGGVGAAIIYPEARKHHELGNRVISLMGARSRELFFFVDEMKAVSDRMLFSTDDGSFGHHGLVTDILKQVIDEGEKIDEVIAIGPIPMMKAVADLTKPYKIKTIVSLNPIMVDGTGMCGACRVTVGGEVKFSCSDGPEFDAHLVDFDELLNRSRQYREQERLAFERYEREREGECAGQCLKK